MLLFSPLFGCLYLCLFIIALYAWGEIDRYFMYSDSKDITRITEMNFPEFSTKHYYPENPSFTGDFSNYRVIKFEDIPSDAFYHGLGLKNVRHRIEKYSGTMNVDIEDNCFVNKIVLYGIQTKNDKVPM